MSDASLSDVQALAITKAVKGKMVKTAREGVEPGEYAVDFDVHVAGTVRVGADYEQRVPAKAKPWDLVATLMEENARLAAAAGEAGIDLDKLVKMADAVNPDLAKEAKTKADEAIAKIKAATVSSFRGKVTADIEVTPIR